MRLFIAIEFMDDFFKELQNKIQNPALRLTKSYHLTLKFLGETDNLDEIKEKLSKVKFPKFNVVCDKIGLFPNEKAIRIIWVGLEDNSKINDLQKEVESSLLDLFPKDNRFHPHITFARVKKPIKFEKIDISKKEFNVNSFKLIKSTLTPEGPVYEDIVEVELK